MRTKKQEHGRIKEEFNIVVFRRRVFVILILLLQISFFLLMVINTGNYFRNANFILRVISIGVCVYVINKREKASFKITWVFLIMLFPIFGGIFYISFYIVSNPKKMRARIQKNIKDSKDAFFAGGDILQKFTKLHPEFEAQAKYLQNYSGFPVYEKTKSIYFASGEDFFKQVLEELEKAQKYIFLEFFILREGLMLNSIVEILARKAKEGVIVRLIYDDLGCFMSLPPDFKIKMENKGIKCFVFNPFRPNLSSLHNYRDHRKIISIDGKIAFTGGLNLADEYINAVQRFGHWKDAAIMLQGEGAWSLTLIFLQMWNTLTFNSDYDFFYPWKNFPCEIQGDGFVQPYADNPINDDNVGEHVYLQIINNAKKYVYINTPYLVLDDGLLSALILAAKSGVDVKIITPHRWDKKIVAIASRSYYRKLIIGGVKVYEYTSGFNHGKTFVCDDAIATVGTTNLDFRSLYLHFECGVLVYKSELVNAVKEDFLKTIPISHEVTLQECTRNIYQRIVPDLLQIFAPVM